MRLARILVATAAAAFWTTVTLVADQHGHAPVTHTAQAHGTPKTTTAPKPPASTTTKHATNTGSTHSSTTTSNTGKSMTTRSTTTAPGTTTTTGGTKTGGTTPSTPTGGRHHDGDHHSGTHTPSPSSSPIATKIQSHPNLAAKVTAMLPQGMTMNQAARGFKNQGQFIAALHASQRTGIPFSDLKRAMVTRHESLGQAIHSLRPSASGSREAEHDADHDLGGSHSGTGGTTIGTTTGTPPTTTSTTTRKHDK